MFNASNLLLRIGIVDFVDQAKQKVYIHMYDQARNRIECPIYHPLASGSSGIFSSLSKNTYVVVGFTFNEQPLILSTIQPDFFTKNSSLLTTKDSFLRDMEEGDVLVKNTNTELKVKKDQVSISTKNNKLIIDNRVTEFISEKQLNITGSGFKIEGPTVRDKQASTNELSTSLLFDFTKDINFFKSLSKIGRNNNIQTSNISNKNNSTSVRNPAFVEAREVYYNFEKDSFVKTDKKEIEIYSDTSLFNELPGKEDALSTTFNISTLTPNILLEKNIGFAVDSFGNILDINRNVIKLSQNGDDLQVDLLKLKRAIKFHFEINSDKNIDSQISNTTNANINKQHVDNIPIANSHSRLYVDIDGEGLTKINIPSSSDFGNLPLPTRYIPTSLLENTNLYKTYNKEVNHLIYASPNTRSSSGIPLEGDLVINSTTENSVMKYTTVYHNIEDTCRDITESDCVDMTAFNNSIENGNVGGRSLSLNLDGSMESNIGRDTKDNKSIVLDASGSAILNLGRDKKEQSLVLQTEGKILVEAGNLSIAEDNKGIIDDDELEIVILVKGATFQNKIILNKTGMIMSGNNVVINASNNLVLNAVGTMMLNAGDIKLYGQASEDGSEILNAAGRLANTGKIK